MARVIAAFIVVAGLGACERHIVHCESASVPSPDRECRAQLVQDVSTDGTCAVVDCAEFHYPPYPDWNAVVLKGTAEGMSLKWLGNRTIEVTVSQGAVIRQYQRSIQSRSYAVEVALRGVTSTDPRPAGCALGDRGI